MLNSPGRHTREAPRAARRCRMAMAKMRTGGEAQLKYSAVIMLAASWINAGPLCPASRANARNPGPDPNRSGPRAQKHLEREVDENEGQYAGKRNHSKALFDEMPYRLPIAPQQPGDEKELAAAGHDG